MKKVTPTAPTPSDSIAVSVVSFGNDPIALLLPAGSTVAEALTAAGITRGAQEFFVSGEAASDNDILESGDVLSIVTPKQAGHLHTASV